MKDFEQLLQAIYAKNLEEKSTWYSAVASAYDRTRPRYPQAVINRVVKLAQLPPQARILEVGCGPGIATTKFAQQGFAMLCLEPSLEAVNIARQNCAAYPDVEFQNTTFEAWPLAPKSFDAVLAATSFHWISPEIRHLKAADALKANGSLILLWNTPALPANDVYQVLKPIYRAQAPVLGEYHANERNAQVDHLQQFGQLVTDSGYFKNLIFEQVACEATYSIEDYLMLLSTLSPYIALDPQQQQALFADLRGALEKTCGKRLQTTYLSAFHVAQKK